MAIPTQYPSRITVSLPPEEEVRKVIGDTYDPHKVLNVFQMFAGTGDMYFATVGFVRAIFQAEGIGPKMPEMIILRCAKVLDSPYEWQANAVLAKNIGLSDDEILAAGCVSPRITFFRPMSVCVGSGVHSAIDRKLDPKFLEQGLRLEIGGPERDGLVVQQRPMVNDLDNRVGPGTADVEYRHDVAILGNDVVVAEPGEIEHVGNTWQ